MGLEATLCIFGLFSNACVFGISCARMLWKGSCLESGFVLQISAQTSESLWNELQRAWECQETLEVSGRISEAAYVLTIPTVNQPNPAAMNSLPLYPFYLVLRDCETK